MSQARGAAGQRYLYSCRVYIRPEARLQDVLANLARQPRCCGRPLWQVRIWTSGGCPPEVDAQAVGAPRLIATRLRHGANLSVFPITYRTSAELYSAAYAQTEQLSAASTQ